AWDAADETMRDEAFAAYRAFSTAVRSRGSLVVGDALERPEAGRVLRAATEGPFAETVEQLGGFYVVDLPDLETAVECAELLPAAYAVEVRPTLGVDV